MVLDVGRSGMVRMVRSAPMQAGGNHVRHAAHVASGKQAKKSQIVRRWVALALATTRSEWAMSRSKNSFRLGMKAAEHNEAS